MKKINIANVIIYDLANKFTGSNYLDINDDIVDLVAENWCKKHFVSTSYGVKNHHDKRSQQRFLM